MTEQLYGARAARGLDFHPHLHALVADGLFVREQGRFHVLPETRLQPLEELFRTRVIAFLVKEGLLPTRYRLEAGDFRL